MNFVALSGRLSHDLELKQNKDNKNYIVFRLAVQRDYNREETDFISVVAWSNSAEFLSHYAGKGDKIAVEGRLTVSTYAKADGTTQYSTQVVATHVELLAKKQEKQA